MEGVFGALVSLQKGTIQYEILNNMGNLLVLQCEEYYLLELKISLFRPQTYLNSQKNRCNRM